MSEQNTSSNAVLNAVSIVAFFWFLGVLIKCFQGDIYPTYGNVHDFFIPLNSAYALSTGEVLHETFRSPFGIIYHYLNYWAWSLAEYFPAIFSTLDSLLLSSVIFDVFVVALFFLIRHGQERDQRLPFWVLLILLTITFQARNIDALRGQIPNWYGLYNNHLWAVLVLQISSLMPWGLKREGVQKAIYLAVIMALCVSVSFNYKISFLVGSAVLCLAPMLFFSRAQLLAYVLTGISACSAIFLGVLATGYSYRGYYDDIMQAIAAKSSGGILSDVNILMIVGFVILLQIARGNLNWNPNRSASFSENMRASVANLFRQLNSRTIVFDAILIFGVALASAGDFNKPVFFYFLIIFIFRFWGRGKEKPIWQFLENPVQYLVAIIVFATVFFNISSLEKITKFNQSTELVNPYVDYSETRVSINMNDRPLSFNVFWGASMSKFNSTGVHVKSSDWKDATIRMSYTIATTNVPLLPVYDNWNAIYLKSINEVSARLTSIGLGRGTDTKVQNIGFINPYPFVLETPFLQKNYHWVHIGTTIRESDINKYFDTLLDADVAVIPIAAASPRLQTLLNCAFYKWNFEQIEPFVIVDVLEENLLLSRANLAALFGPQDFSTVDMVSIIDYCET